MKRLKYIATILILIISTLAITLFFCRSKVTDYISHQIENYSFNGSRISCTSIGFSGLDGISITDFSLISPMQDTVVQIKKLSINVSLTDLLSKKINLKSVKIQDTYCNIKSDSLSSNIDFLFQSSDSIRKDTILKQPTNFSDKLYRIARLSFQFIPYNLDIKNLNFQLDKDSSISRLKVEEGAIKSGKCDIPFSIEKENNIQNLLFKGEIDKGAHELDGTLMTNVADITNIRFANDSDFFIEFEKIKFNLNFPTLSEDETVIKTDFQIDSLVCFQQRISEDTIKIPVFQSSLEVNIFPNEIILTPVSKISCDELTIHPHIELRKGKDWVVGIYIDETGIDAEDLISSLPEGLFNPIKSVRLTGKVDYHFLLEVDMNNPDSLRIESDIKTKDFRIINPGVLTKMNQDFLLPVYENEKLVRTINVGNSNPDFRSMNEVSPLLINAILQSEDGQFFYHKGFRLDAIREALIHDIKMRRFARGGSTISMQIVKNVFLNRNKTIARKLEEALIVWLIESNKITSKQRMFDVYLNIAEWGPDIYGVKEASYFYFQKEPSDLNLDEAIFMASVIPRPKKFYWSLDEYGQIKESLYPHFRIVRNRLERNNIIEALDSSSIYIPHINITGPAKSYISKHKTAISDSINIDLSFPFGL